VAEDLRQTWTQRMADLLEVLPKRTVLLWMSGTAPEPRAQRRGLRDDPVLVDRGMVAEIVPKAQAYVEAVTSPRARQASLEGMAFAALEALAAAALPGPSVHREVAARLAQALDGMIR
jgi:Domain of unknown function (DUF6473)